jgi:hypothetical protein
MQKELHYVIPVLKKGTRNIKSIAYTSLVRSILEYGIACREGQINGLG